MTRTPLMLCFPHAGGTAAALRPLVAALAPWARVRLVELPGHGTRGDEPVHDEMASLVPVLVGELAAAAAPGYIAFGHSFGALVAHQVALALRPLVGEPLALVVTGRDAPWCAPTWPPLHGLPAAVLAQRLVELGGLPDVLASDPDLLDLFLPALRADLRIAETWQASPTQVLACDVHVVSGHGDVLTTPSGLSAWAAATTGSCHVTQVPGGHMCQAEPAYLAAVAASTRAAAPLAASRRA